MTVETNITYSVLSSESIKKYDKELKLKVSNTNGMYIIHRALVQQLHEKRQGNANCKNRSEVRGGGKKPWKQKGTGKARAGSIRSPLWRGGGVIFGPKSKEFHKKINKREKQLALRTLLYNKKQNTIIIENTENLVQQTKTQKVLKQLKNLQIDTIKQVLIIVGKKEKQLYLTTRNLHNIEIIDASHINIYAILKAQTIIIEAKALDIIHKIYNG
uniref:Large ribosomal subunit protein uL4c n=1 Tax=Sporolithon durum TaxID=48970 RepID=A0A141SD96_9FLOR|nr:ribosomal protein L4 [Sporolithon durum]AMK96264.1 ribosomal protein L4 [Sporolithon durum]